MPLQSDCATDTRDCRACKDCCAPLRFCLAGLRVYCPATPPAALAMADCTPETADTASLCACFSESIAESTLRRLSRYASAAAAAAGQSVTVFATSLRCVAASGASLANADCVSRDVV